MIVWLGVGLLDVGLVICFRVDMLICGLMIGWLVDLILVLCWVMLVCYYYGFGWCVCLVICFSLIVICGRVEICCCIDLFWMTLFLIGAFIDWFNSMLIFVFLFSYY